MGGEDPQEVRYFEIGKQYLLLRPERQYLVDKGHWKYKDVLEFETYFEEILHLFGWISSRTIDVIGSTGASSESQRNLGATTVAPSASSRTADQTEPLIANLPDELLLQ